jgi:hypothetical protein
MSLQGNVSSLSKFAQSMSALPRTLAVKVTERAAPALTEIAKETFAAHEDSYGAPWVPGADGTPVTLEESGALKRQVFYVAIGTRLRVSIGVPYAKYQIGKRPVYPRQGAPLPVTYSKKLAEIAQDAAREELAK